METKTEKVKSSQLRALFTSLNSPGHLNSLLGIADILKKRGFKTTFMVLGPMMMPTVYQNGHDVVTIEDTEAWIDRDNNDRVHLGASKWPVIMEKCSKYFSMSPLEAHLNTVGLFDSVMTNEIKHQDDKYNKIIEDIDPHVIVIDNYFIPPCIVTNKRPWVRVYSANPLALLSTYDDCPPAFAGFSIPDKQKAEDEPEIWLKHKQEWDNYKRIVSEKVKQSHADWDAWLQNLGCPPLSNNNTMAHDSPHLNLYMFPKCIDYDDRVVYPKRWVRCNSLLRCGEINTDTLRGMNNIIEAKRKLGKKLIFFSMGSLASGDVALMTNLINVLSKSKHFFIIAKGVNGDQYELPDNMWGQMFLPQLVALSEVDMAITHGGNNSLTECFYFGCPMIVMPVFGDQLDNAQRVVDKGFGKRFDPYRPVESELLEAIDEIINNTELKNRMKEISSEMQSDSGATKGADMVEMLAKEGSLDDETINRLNNV